MLRLLLFISIIFLISCNSQKNLLNKGDAPSDPYYAELAIERVKDYVILPVRIKGKTYRFLFDTGAPFMLKSSLFDKVTTSVDSIPIRDINNQIEQTKLAITDSIWLGSIPFVGVPAMEMAQDNFLVECMGFDGIIGSNFVRQSIIEVDVKQSVFRITNKKDQLPQPPTDVIEMQTDLDQQSSPILKVKFGEKVSELLMFDSGADELYSIGHRNLKQLSPHATFDTLAISKGYDSNFGLFSESADTARTLLISPKSLILGETTFKEVICQVDFQSPSRLGAALFNYGIVHLDYKNEQFGFTPYGKGDTLFSQEKQFALSPTYNGDFIVGHLYQDFEGIQAGDEIISVNGINVDSLSLCELFKLPSIKSYEELQLQIRTSDGKLMEVQIPEIKLNQGGSGS